MKQVIDLGFVPVVHKGSNKPRVRASRSAGEAHSRSVAEIEASIQQSRRIARVVLLDEDTYDLEGLEGYDPAQPAPPMHNAFGLNNMRTTATNINRGRHNIDENDDLVWVESES